VVPRLASVVTAGDFALETFHGAVADFHATDLLADVRPRIVVCAAEAAALVLGSRQPFDTVDVDACRRAGIDPRFESVAHDVGASMRWLGEHVAAALRSFGVAAVKVHDGPMTGGRWSPLVCFAGVGPGEVLLGRRKLVGISQRRTRRGARFQCMVHVRWSPDVLVGLLAVPRPTVDELPPVAVVSREIADALPRAVARSLTDAKG
jgi:lipoate---protein ligase